MDWNDAKHFLAVAREGQVLAAAGRLGISQATLSRRIAALEEAVGARLFARSTRGAALTDAGRLFLETAERVEAEMLAAAERLKAVEAAPGGTVRIGAPDGLGSAYLAPRLGLLGARYPALRVQLVPLTRSFSLSQREADVAIMIGRPQKGRLRARRLADYTLGLYATRDYLAAHGTPQRVEDLARHRLVGYVDDLIPTAELNYAEEVWRGWTSAFEVATAIGQREVVASGAAIGLLHDFMVAADPRFVPLLADRKPVRSYVAVWHENLAGSRRLSAVVDFLAEQMKRERALFSPGS
ncbi:LysR family transcriptional regulator [Acuticoccus sp. I52.16.1]|uniref:LysR family transcriptional regulator n=1 Tax=Acuticoccus sp. I52.16.1 TaxID=2928472 RepID=UPI001FD0FFED|nr:LysR family transcriptional regulator [Acuticoccus sp. I52.16.1]UOM33476.1 LysR family transcriptional regulator [Acuticoccus sp. I52.16.1]